MSRSELAATPGISRQPPSHHRHVGVVSALHQTQAHTQPLNGETTALRMPHLKGFNVTTGSRSHTHGITH